jgi:hypothetical protein
MGRAAIIPRDAEPAGSGDLADLRFRALLGSEAWAALPAAVRRRFSKRMGPGQTVTYRGAVTEIEASPAGTLLSQVARLIGAPLPLWFEPGAAIVSVTEDRVGQGQVWTRLYVRATGFPQVIHSAKRFAGPTGLEEHLGLGVGMALTTTVEDGVLTFRSAFYFIDLMDIRLRLPRWAGPGDLTVIHAEAGEDRFVFGLDLVHPLLGRLIRQRGLFEDVR